MQHDLPSLSMLEHASAEVADAAYRVNSLNPARQKRVEKVSARQPGDATFDFCDFGGGHDN